VLIQDDAGPRQLRILPRGRKEGCYLLEDHGQVAPHLAGSPGKPVVDTAGPLRMQPGDRLLLCSDGLWGALSDTVICEQMARQPLSDAVPELVEQALRSAGAKSDNVTVLCVEWEAAEDADSQSGVSTKDLGDQVFASTIQASLLGDAPPDELDDAEIERSIREINEAIQRSSQRKN
jgi:serine/threonine protein phosphatase PrpC